MAGRPRLLLVEIGGAFKAFLLERLRSLGVELFLASARPEAWATQYFDDRHVIPTDPYNSIRLVGDVAAFGARAGTTFDGVGTFWEHAVTQTADLAAALGLPGVPPGAARRTSNNKLLMRTWCAKAGIPMPHVEVLRGLNELAPAMARFRGPAVVKPLFGDDSFGVHKIDAHTDILEVIEECRRTWSAAHPAFVNFPDVWLLEEYVPGRMVSVDGIVQHRRVHLAGLVEIGMGPEPRFTQCANWVPPRISPEATAACGDLARRVIDALGLDHCGFHCEIRLGSRDDPTLIEIAARLPGGLIPKAYHDAYGLHLADAMLAVWMGAEATLAPARRVFVLQKGVFPDRPGVVVRGSGYADARARPGVREIVEVTGVGDAVQTYPDVPKPLYLYAVEGETAAARDELGAWVERTVTVEVA